MSAWSLLFFSWILIQILLIPYSKIEERFYLHAIYQLLYPPASFNGWEFLTFKPVSRSLVGPFIAALFCYPIKSLLAALILPFLCSVFGAGTFLVNYEKFIMLHVVRICLGASVVFSLSFFRRSFRLALASFSGLDPRQVDYWFCLLTLSQFHLLYYASRTLPNTFALVPFLNGLGYWLQRKYIKMLLWAIPSVVIFRFDFLAFWAPLILLEFLYLRRSQIVKIIYSAAALSLCFIIGSISFDSVWYKKLIWPEATSILYNIMENKSHLYGVHSWHWYLSSAFPRLFTFSLCFIPMTPFLIDQPMRFTLFRLLLPVALGILAFSCLPHKETRFIFPAIPVINLVLALSIFANKKIPNSLKYGTLLLMLGCTLASLYASYFNYPSGPASLAAQTHLLDLKKARSDFSLYLDIYTGMNGWNLFCDLDCAAITYDDLQGNHAAFASNHTHLLTGNPKLYSKDFQIIRSEMAFSHLDVNHLKLMLIKCWTTASIMWPATTCLRDISLIFVFSPKVYLMERIMDDS